MQKKLTHLSLSSVPAAQAAIVHGGVGLHKDQEAWLHSQSHHSACSQKAAALLLGPLQLSTCPGQDQSGWDP